MHLRLENTKKEAFGETLTAIIDLSQSYKSTPQPVSGFEANLYDNASKLSDDGYGDFNACLEILRSCNGNLREAQKLLSSDPWL